MSNYTLPSMPPGIRRLTDPASAALSQRHPQSVGSPRNCETCKGQRTFRWYGSGDEIVTYDCDCNEQYLMSRWFWYCGVYPRYQRLGWRDLVRPEFAGLKDYLDYLDNCDAYMDAGLGMMFHGPRGTGKTLIAHLMVKSLIAKGTDAYVTTFEKMIDSYAGGWRDKDQEAWFNQRVRDAGVLLIDDLGRERNKGSGTVGENMLESVIRHRVACQLPTLITTNLDPDADLGSMYGGHTLSLLSECSTACEVDGLDARLDIKTRAKEEIKQGLRRPVVVG